MRLILLVIGLTVTTIAAYGGKEVALQQLEVYVIISYRKAPIRTLPRQNGSSEKYV
jgi:hypothetical protein